MLDLAHEKGTKVLLTITCFGKTENNYFFANEFNQIETAISQIMATIENYNLDGVDINFENVPKNNQPKFTEFAKLLKTKIDELNTAHELTITIPKINTAFDIPVLNDLVDYYILTGYDFYTRGSRTDGPIAPLKASKNRLSIEKVVHNWEEEGIRVEKARWGRHNIIKGKLKIELAKTVDAAALSLDEVQALIEEKAPKKKTAAKKKTTAKKKAAKK